MKRWQKCLLVTLFFSFTSTYAADAKNPHWQFDVAPYAWLLNMNGRVATGPFKTHVSQNFSDILHHLNAGGMMFVQAHKGPMGFYGNGLFAVLSDHGSRGRLDASLKNRFGIYGAGLSYILFQRNYPSITPCESARLQIEPYLGFRYTRNNVNLTLNRFTVKNDQSWTDPLLGLRVNYAINTNWLALLAVDLGGINTNSQYSYDLNGFIGYQPSACALKNTSFYLGYRYLYQHYDTGSGRKLYEWNMRLFGPVLGVNFSF